MSVDKHILITGGAGYIGSHVALKLGEAGEAIVTLDNLSVGRRESVLFGDLVIGEVGDRHTVLKVLRDYNVDTVMHFAAHTIVPESVSNPLKYYANNTVATRNLLECCRDAGVGHFVFSSTAAVYGDPPDGIAGEELQPKPSTPYGRSKLMSEWMLADTCAAGTMRHVTLRYFNVAGCDPGGRIGLNTPDATLLIKVACEHAVGLRPYMSIFGDDFATPDGSGVRDFIHVDDLAEVHVLAMRHLRSGGESLLLNCGYGHGYSVRQVVETLRRVHGGPLDVRIAPRRPGDLGMVIARAERLRERFGWSPRYDDLDFIVGTALDWERKRVAAA
jgi:UDP-glucose 4-epimerase